MNKYLLTFEKKGYIKYTSHLDMQRFFQRIFRRSGIKLAYSQGFNPHPKMSFALPLSLGYTGLEELLEIETAIPYDTEEIKAKVNEIMPEGLSVVGVSVFESKKTAGSMVNAAEFIITIPVNDCDKRDYNKIGTDFMAQSAINTQKLQRKTGKILDIDIRPLIKDMVVNVVDNNIIIETTIAQGSQETLSPELLISTFVKFAGFDVDPVEIDYTRKKIIYTKPE
ncbi:MAG: DUF2344 domain-containing protein [Clostridiales bacterium]|nr:DUF2344 domain-containing protein [Clostridiales bacterium]